MSWFYMAMQREPVVMWSCFIGALGAYPRLTARPSPDAETLLIRTGGFFGGSERGPRVRFERVFRTVF